MFDRVFHSSRPGTPHPMCSEWEKVAPGWCFMIALSLNVGGVVRLMKLRYYGKPIHMHVKTINISYRYEPDIVLYFGTMAS